MIYNFVGSLSSVISRAVRFLKFGWFMLPKTSLKILSLEFRMIIIYQLLRFHDWIYIENFLIYFWNLIEGLNIKGPDGSTDGYVEGFSILTHLKEKNGRRQSPYNFRWKCSNYDIEFCSRTSNILQVELSLKNEEVCRRISVQKFWRFNCRMSNVIIFPISTLTFVIRHFFNFLLWKLSGHQFIGFGF